MAGQKPGKGKKKGRKERRPPTPSQEDEGEDEESVAGEGGGWHAGDERGVCEATRLLTQWGLGEYADKFEEEQVLSLDT